MRATSTLLILTDRLDWMVRVERFATFGTGAGVKDYVPLIYSVYAPLFDVREHESASPSSSRDSIPECDTRDHRSLRVPATTKATAVYALLRLQQSSQLGKGSDGPVGGDSAV